MNGWEIGFIAALVILTFFFAWRANYWRRISRRQRDHFAWAITTQRAQHAAMMCAVLGITAVVAIIYFAGKSQR